jgi:hypothetical protein
MVNDYQYKELRRDRDGWKRLAENRARMLKKRDKTIDKLKKEKSNG